MAEDDLAPATSSTHLFHYGFPGGASGKEHACQCRRLKRLGFDPCIGKIPWRRAWQCSPVFLPREFHGQWSLVRYKSIGSCFSHTGFSFFALLTYDALPWFRAFTLTLPSARTTPTPVLAGSFSFFIHRDYVLDFWSLTSFIHFTKLCILKLRIRGVICSVTPP